MFNKLQTKVESNLDIPSKAHADLGLFMDHYSRKLHLEQQKNIEIVTLTDAYNIQQRYNMTKVGIKKCYFVIEW